MSKKQSTDYEQFEHSSPGNRRLLRQEELILEVTEALAEAIERKKVTQSEIARRLRRTKGFVSQILSGGRNLTLRTIADLADALEQRVKLRLCDQDEWLESSLGDERPTVTTWAAVQRPTFKLVRQREEVPAGDARMTGAA